MNLNTDPVRKISLAGFGGGDAWAQPGAQVAPPANVLRLVATGGDIRWRVIGYDGTGPESQPVDGDATTYDMTVVKIRTDLEGNVTLARTVTLVESEGALVPTGEQLTERDISPNEIFALGFVSTLADTATAVWVFIDAGAKPKRGSSGTA